MRRRSQRGEGFDVVGHARDNGNSAGAHYASPDSSGIAQQPYNFSAIFHHFDLIA